MPGVLLNLAREYLIIIYTYVRNHQSTFIISFSQFKYCDIFQDILKYTSP